MDLCSATGMRTRFGVLAEGRVTYIEQRPGPEPITSFSTGATLPAHASAAGKAILAFVPPSDVARAAQDLTVFTGRTLNSQDRLHRALRIARLARVAVASGELTPEQSDVAVPVFGGGGAQTATGVGCGRRCRLVSRRGRLTVLLFRLSASGGWSCGEEDG
ncbi:MAG: hypothetical protein QOH17_2029 [Pseudonocardiales bacterium]|nr:hypothetical protein [Pseudonocardiales bacterium]